MPLALGWSKPSLLRGVAIQLYTLYLNVELNDFLFHFTSDTCCWHRTLVAWCLTGTMQGYLQALGFDLTQLTSQQSILLTKICLAAMALLIPLIVVSLLLTVCGKGRFVRTAPLTAHRPSTLNDPLSHFVILVLFFVHCLPHSLFFKNMAQLDASPVCWSILFLIRWAPSLGWHVFEPNRTSMWEEKENEWRWGRWGNEVKD